MNAYTFSVIIPAHNEEQYIGKCLRAVQTAAGQVLPARVQIIVVANRCTDQTAQIAESFGAVVIPNQDKCISKIRNAGAKAASGKIIVTVDADSCMSPDALSEIRQMLRTGKYVGAHLLPIAIGGRTLPVGGMFWCRKKDFDAIGGFDERLVSLEDMDFAVRLNRHGRKTNRKYTVLRHAYILTSSRKFDQFGDWYLIRNSAVTKQIFTGKNREAADKFYYDVR